MVILISTLRYFGNGKNDTFLQISAEYCDSFVTYVMTYNVSSSYTVEIDANMNKYYDGRNRPCVPSSRTDYRHAYPIFFPDAGLFDHS